MGVRTDDVFVTTFAMTHQGEQVALRPRRNEQCGGETEFPGEALLQGIDRGVLAVDVVTDRRAQHGFAHGLGGLGDGVAAQVDHWHGGGASLEGGGGRYYAREITALPLCWLFADESAPTLPIRR